MALVRRIARPLLSATFFYGGLNALTNTDVLAKRAEPVSQRVLPVVDNAFPLPGTLDTKQLVRANGVVQLVGGFLLATDRAPRLAALALAASLVPTSAAGHRFWKESDPQQRSNQRAHFVKNVSMMGGLLLAAVDTDGEPSLAWRAKRQISIARKANRHISIARKANRHIGNARRANRQLAVTTKSATKRRSA